MEKDSILKGDKQNLSAPWPTGKEQWPHRRPNQTYLLKLESPVEVGQQWLAVGARALAVAILEGASWRESPWKLQKIKTSFINNVSYFYSTRRARIGFWTLFGFWSFSSNTEAPGGDITSKYGQGTLWKRELGSNPGQPRTGEQNHAQNHSACSLLPASACVWLSALTWDFYSFTIIHVCVRSEHFLVILLSQRVSYKLIGMLLEVWNPEIGMLFSIQQRKVLTLKALWNYHPRWKENTFARGLAPFQCCLPVTVSDQLSCLLPEGSHTVILTVLMISARIAWCLLCDMDSLNPDNNSMKTTVIVPSLKWGNWSAELFSGVPISYYPLVLLTYGYSISASFVAFPPFPDWGHRTQF